MLLSCCASAPNESKRAATPCNASSTADSGTVMSSAQRSCTDSNGASSWRWCHDTCSAACSQSRSPTAVAASAVSVGAVDGAVVFPAAVVASSPPRSSSRSWLHSDVWVRSAASRAQAASGRRCCEHTRAEPMVAWQATSPCCSMRASATSHASARRRGTALPTTVPGRLPSDAATCLCSASHPVA